MVHITRISLFEYSGVEPPIRKRTNLQSTYIHEIMGQPSSPQRTKGWVPLVRGSTVITLSYPAEDHERNDGGL